VALPVSRTDVVENVQWAFSPHSRGHVYFVRRLALAHETGVAVGALACTRALCPSAPLDSEYVDALSRATSFADEGQQLSVELNYYVEKPESFEPKWLVGFNIGAVVENVLARLF